MKIRVYHLIELIEFYLDSEWNPRNTLLAKASPIFLESAACSTYRKR